MTTSTKTTNTATAFTTATSSNTATTSNTANTANPAAATAFISTAIPFVNAEPHLGFAYELVLADILARHGRRRGDAVYFLTGTDDNSLKNVTAAVKAGLSTRELVARNSAAFRSLAPLLDLSPDDFVATSTDPRHQPAVELLWRACAAKGDLYRRAYTGRYCPGCEAFVDDDVTYCAEHERESETVHETNWFFRLSRYRDEIRALIESNTVRIVSDAARAETLAFLAGDVRDLSVSRDAARANNWGIPVPGDPSQVIYVWFDALTNYLSALDLAGDRGLFDRFWAGAALLDHIGKRDLGESNVGESNIGVRNIHERDVGERNIGARTHVIGKGISRFHAVYWLAFLLSAELPLPTTIAVHGYLTVDGRKISKSTNPAPVPPVVERWGIDALRWFFARHCRTRVDSDVPRDNLGDAYDRDLADRLGNLVQRTISLIEKLGLGDAELSVGSRVTDVLVLRVPESRETPETLALRASAEAVPERVDRALAAFLPDEAAGAIIDLLDAANRYLDQVAPWRLAKTDREAAIAALYAPLEAARFAAGELAPFVPGVSRVIASRLGRPDLAPVWGALRAGGELRGGPPPLPKRSPR
jgi:methionyl-tRNA synthetase